MLKLSSTLLLRCQYIKQSKLDEIAEHYKEVSYWNSIKKIIKVTGYLCTQGFKDGKADIKYFWNNYRSQDLNVEQKKRMYQIKYDLYRLPPLAILFWFPGGFLIIFGYITLFPPLIPTWMQTDNYRVAQCIDFNHRQKQAFNLFTKSQSIFPNSQGVLQTRINMETFRNFSYMEKRKVQQLCFGIATDGTYYFNQIFKAKTTYFLQFNLSNYLVKRSVEELMEIEDLQQLKKQVGPIQNSENADILTYKIINIIQKLKTGESVCKPPEI